MLASELAYTSMDSTMSNRGMGDVENYAKYLLYSLRQFIDGEPLLRHNDPPALRRHMGDGTNWLPDKAPLDWDMI
jgi:hypothetical protein